MIDFKVKKTEHTVCLSHFPIATGGGGITATDIKILFSRQVTKAKNLYR